LNLPRLLSVDQVAEYLGVKSRYMRDLISRGEIKYVRVGAKNVKNVRITQEAVMDFIEKKTVTPPKTVIDGAKYSGLKSTIKRNRSLKSKDETVEKMGDYSVRLAEELRDSWR
jgi:excisionase family DNA binding protein